uniref:Uncharacterized protein n=1 Tax=Anguilla anguilla TaxID=7936 RepID=A0A0E9W4I4_ANGAN
MSECVRVSVCGILLLWLSSSSSRCITQSLLRSRSYYRFSRIQRIRRALAGTFRICV